MSKKQIAENISRLAEKLKLFPGVSAELRALGTLIQTAPDNEAQKLVQNLRGLERYLSGVVENLNKNKLKSNEVRKDLIEIQVSLEKLFKVTTRLNQFINKKQFGVVQRKILSNFFAQENALSRRLSRGGNFSNNGIKAMIARMTEVLNHPKITPTMPIPQKQSFKPKEPSKVSPPKAFLGGSFFSALGDVFKAFAQPKSNNIQSSLQSFANAITQMVTGIFTHIFGAIFGKEVASSLAPLASNIQPDFSQFFQPTPPPRHNPKAFPPAPSTPKAPDDDNGDDNDSEIDPDAAAPPAGFDDTQEDDNGIEYDENGFPNVPTHPLIFSPSEEDLRARLRDLNDGVDPEDAILQARLDNLKK